MDDLEKAILISFDETGAVNSVLKEQALGYISQVKDSPPICRICIEKLCFSKLVQVQFWSLQSLHEALHSKYTSVSEEEKSLIRKSVFSMVCYEPLQFDDGNSVRLLDGPAFIKNKLAQVFVTLIRFEYPVTWPSVFVDFLPNLAKGAVVIDMFCRVLNALDDEVINVDDQRGGDGVAVAGRIKDAMRVQCVPQIVATWYHIVTMYKISEPELCSSVLDSMTRYISWIDIGLVATDAFTKLLFEMMLVDRLEDQVRAAAARVVLAVVSKRMDSKSKLVLLQGLQLRRVFGLVMGDTDSELVSSVASLLTGYATELLECSKHLSTGDGEGVSMNLLNEVLPSVFHVMQNCEVDATFSIVQFLSDYVGRLKRISALTDLHLVHVTQILEVIRAQIKYDPMHRNNLDILDKIGKAEEDRMREFRKDLLTLLGNVNHVAPDLSQVFIRNSLVNAVASSDDCKAEEVEASLTLFHALGGSLSKDAIRTGSGQLGELVPMLLSTRFPCHSNRLVAIVYLETIRRYIEFVSENTQYLPAALSAFLDERGIHHPNANVRRKASNVFTRVVKDLKSKLVPYIETILQSLQDMVAQFTTTNSAAKEFSGSEDGSDIFEAIGILIGMEDVPLEKQSDYLSALLTPLCQQVEAALLNARSNSTGEPIVQIINIGQIVIAIYSLSKGFSERLVTSRRPGIGLMFKKTLDILLEILVVFPKVEPLRSKVTSFIHRMVEILGASVFPHLPKALGQLLTESEPKELVSFLVLLNQIICKFGTRVRDILEDIYPNITNRVFNILPKNEIQSGQGSCAEEIRELQELQRTFFTFLHVIVTHDLSLVLLSPRGRGSLDIMMQLLLNSSCNHKDVLVRKACVQIFIRLIKDWSAEPYGAEKVAGFGNFIIEVFATNCCLYSVLDSFDFHDSNTILLLGEIVVAQKVMYEKLGNDFLYSFVSKGLSNVHCPQDLAEQYCQKLQGDDVKALKSFYRTLIERLRPQQNDRFGVNIKFSSAASTAEL